MILHIFTHLTCYNTFHLLWNCQISSRSWKLGLHNGKIGFCGLFFGRTSYMKTKYRLWFYIFLQIWRGIWRLIWFGITRFLAELCICFWDLRFDHTWKIEFCRLVFAHQFCPVFVERIFKSTSFAKFKVYM